LNFFLHFLTPWPAMVLDFLVLNYFIDKSLG
jgi:hypothetical protein